MNLIFHHTDLDGYSAAAVVKHFVNNCYCRPVNYKEYLPTIEEIEKIGKTFTTIYIVDYSFTENTLYQLQDLLEEYNVVWIDHHQSSLDILDKLDYENLIYLIDTNYCGAVNTWKHFTNKEVPYCLQLVDSWDCWKHFDEDDLAFKLYFDTKKAKECIDIFIDLLTIETDEMYYKIESYIQESRVLEKYILNTYNNLLKKAYTVQLNGYNCIVINCTLKTSLVFGNELAKYDAGIVWSYNGDVYNYSIYTAKNNINVAQIAETYNGGGHRCAAGFTSKEMLI